MRLPVHPKFDLVDHTQLLLGSFRHWMGRDLIPLGEDSKAQAMELFFAPFVVVSHGVEADPILNYGNQCALKLWEMGWDEFIHTPSRLTAEAMNRQERETLLSRVGREGFMEDYSGVRISKSGNRFRIHQATVWNLLDSSGVYRGQAATFDTWEWMK